MRISELSSDIWNYLDMERHLNEGSPSGFSDVHRPRVGLTSKDRGDQSIPIAFFRLSLNQVVSYGKTPADLGHDGLLFPVHPDMVERFTQTTGLKPQLIVPASATSSGRTLLAEVFGRQQFIKLSYHALLGRVTRYMTPHHVLSAIEVSETVRNALEGNPVPRFSIQHEYYGVSADIAEDGWGFVLRDLDPYPSSVFEYRIPAFSLFSRTFGGGPATPLLVQLIEKRPELFNAESFFGEFLLPLLEGYFLLLRRTGLQLEAHSQNLIYHLDKDFRLATITYRDMESVDKDISLIQEAGLSTSLTPMAYKSLSRRDRNYAIKHSFMFDFKLGEYFLRPLCNTWATATRSRVEELHEMVRGVAQRHLAYLPEDFFPPRWYDYGAQVYEGRSDRPYVAHSRPAFR